MKKIRVGYQGAPGAFSTIAGELLVEDPELCPYFSFRNLFQAIADGMVDYGVVPIENSIASSVLDNYDLLIKHQLPILREVRVRITHHLIAPHGVRLEDVRKVYSHPVAIRQCQSFLSGHPGWAVLDGYDTAISVQRVVDGHMLDAAAIAGEACAKIYRANILVRDIGDVPENYTRFFLVGAPQHRSLVVPPDANKAFIVFGLKNVRGALARCLAVFAECGMNLTKIESRPIAERPFDYVFAIEVEVGTDALQESLSIAPLVAQMENTLTFFTVLSCFKVG